MLAHDPSTDPTLPPRANPGPNGEAVTPPDAPEPGHATQASAPGAASTTHATQVQPHAPTHLFATEVLPAVPGYTVSRKIASGGMGVVYAAHDPTFDREVAVKVMRLGQNETRFVVESKVTAQLQHPGIPPVYGLGALADGCPFLAMKLIRGHTLVEELTNAELPRLLGIFEQICLTVGFAHANGIVHRDLKPANVMIGAFGEVQVMDWGLAKSVAGDPDAARGPTEAGTALDLAETGQGVLLGTPAYMAPEQARGEPVDARADVFALGGILAVILTGKPPFGGTTSVDKAKRADLGDCFAALDEAGADPELVELAKHCLAARPDDRPANGQAVADRVAAYRTGIEARLRQAERDRAAAEAKAAEEVNTRREAEARAEAERAKAQEQRKRRNVQLALVGVFVFVLIGGAIAANRVQQQKADDRIAAEKKRSEDLRVTRADGLLQTLVKVDAVEVPRLIDELKQYDDLTSSKLHELALQPVDTKPGLHGRMALLANEPERAGELAAYVPVCRPEELLAIRLLLAPHTQTVAPALWVVLADPKADPGRRVRAAGVLAGLTSDDARWKAVAPAVVEAMVRSQPGEFVVWSAALEPVRGSLLPNLMALYTAAPERIRGSKLDESALAAEVSRYDLTANLLARYATDRPEELAELAIIADPRHYTPFAPAFLANKARVVPLLKAEMATKPKEGAEDTAIDAQAKRQGYAAAALVALGEGESAWSLFRFPSDGDPTARSYLLQRLAAIGADSVTLMRRFEAEADVSAKRALSIALGDFPLEAVPDAERAAFASRLLTLYRDDADSGLHSAIDWLLRQKWGKAKELAAIDAELAARARGEAAVRALTAIWPQLPAPVAAGKNWFVNGVGQTYAVCGPDEFTMGAPRSEPARYRQYATAHQKHIGRTFAIATKEVSVEQVRRLLRDFEPVEESPGPDTPAVRITWYAAAAYCNLLSEAEGIPRDQWCYERNKDGNYAEGMKIKKGHLKLTGYRLPTEAEWEFACRSGSATARYFGRGEALLPRYAWFLQSAGEHAWPVGQRRPNDRGLFDILGNAAEWVEDPWLGRDYDPKQKEDEENGDYMTIGISRQRLYRGGSYYDPTEVLRAARRNVRLPGDSVRQFGFRPARTLIDTSQVRPRDNE